MRRRARSRHTDIHGPNGAQVDKENAQDLSEIVLITGLALTRVTRSARSKLAEDRKHRLVRTCWINDQRNR